MLDLPAHRDMGRPWYLDLATALKLQGELLRNAGSHGVLKPRLEMLEDEVRTT